MTENINTIKARFQNIQERVRMAALYCRRDPDDITLVAVSKTKPVDQIQNAIQAGAAVFGENYIQEAQSKIEALASEKIAWHFIGHLQRNKAKIAVKCFDLIHTLDSLRLARELDKQARKINKVQAVLIQVNISKEISKSGISEDDCLPMIRTASELENLSIKGLMTMPPFFDQPEKARPYFSGLRRLSEEIRQHNINGVSMDLLSMGMTGDFEVAIQEGATHIRIGTAIFGARS